MRFSDFVFIANGGYQTTFDSSGPSEFEILYRRNYFSTFQTLVKTKDTNPKIEVK